MFKFTESSFRKVYLQLPHKSLERMLTSTAVKLGNGSVLESIFRTTR